MNIKCLFNRIFQLLMVIFLCSGCELCARETHAPTSLPFLPSTQVIATDNLAKLVQLGFLGTGWIYDIAWSPNGKQIAVAATAGIYLVDTRSFDETYLSTVEPISIAFSPDGAMLASAVGSEVQLWDISSVKVLRTFRGHVNGATFVAFSPGGKILASVSGNSTIKLWDVASGRVLLTLTGASRPWIEVVFSPDGTRLISGGGQATAKLWDVNSGAELLAMPECIGSMMALSPDGRSLIISQENAIIQCDVNSGKVLNRLDVAVNYPVDLAISPDGAILASGSDNNSIKLWDIKTWQEIRTLNGHEEGPARFIFSPDGQRLVSFVNGAKIKIWDVANGLELQTFTGQSQMSGGQKTWEEYGGIVTSVAFSPNGKIIAGGYQDEGPVKLFDVTTGMLVGELPTQFNFGQVAFSPDGKLVAVGGGNYRTGKYGVQIWDVETHEQVFIQDDYRDRVVSLAFSPDSTILATGAGNGYGYTYENPLKVWKVATGELLPEIRLDVHDIPFDITSNKTVFDLAFNPDGTLLATISADGTVILWDVANQVKIRVMKGVEGQGYAIAISPDGKLLAASGSTESDNFMSGELRLWDLATGELLFLIDAPEFSVMDVAFNPNGQILASTIGGLVRMWDVGTGKKLTEFRGGWVVAFSPDGTLVATGRGHIDLWGVMSP